VPGRQKPRHPEYSGDAYSLNRRTVSTNYQTVAFIELMAKKSDLV